ncbi:hypothetical protein JOB18_024654 [Solea senegalensis]|uniref:Uncharacterized protein n=1 Tax=Solea senegalensis TaxID=28829 RepID=A0AAV6QKA3_SOLSE|nr:hypothetical protein JOB18_024654 [Solea senegalensis]
MTLSDIADLMLNQSLGQSGSSRGLLLPLAIGGAHSEGQTPDGTSFQINRKKRSIQRSSLENMCLWSAH